MTCKTCIIFNRDGSCALKMDEYIKCVENGLSYYEEADDNGPVKV